MRALLADMARLITAREDASALVLVAVVGREPRAAADVVVKDVEAWLPFSQTIGNISALRRLA